MPAPFSNILNLCFPLMWQNEFYSHINQSVKL
jgi:hypothetical protein